MSQHAPSDPIAGDGSDGPSTPAATVERDAVRVRRAVDTDTHEVPVVQYSIESDRDAAAVVRLTDSLPEGLAPSNIGFHDEYHGDDWSVRDEETVAFERRIGGGERLTTLFGVRQDPEAFETVESAPVLEVDGDELDDEAPDETSDADGDDADEGVPETIELDDPIEGDADDATAADDADESGRNRSNATDADDADDGASNGWRGPTDDGLTARRDAAGETPAAADATVLGEPPVDPDTVAGALVEELRGGRLDEDDRDALRQALGRQLSESTTAFVEHVQTRLRSKRERIETEVETLEESVQELYGLKADAGEVDRLAEELSRVDEAAVRTDRFQQLERLVTHLSEAKADLERLEAAEDAAAELREEKADADRVAELEAELDALGAQKADADRVADVESEIERLDEQTVDDARVDDLSEAVERKADAESLAALSETVDGKAEREALEELEAAVDRLDDRAAEAADVEQRIAELRSSKADAEDVESKVEELREGKADVWTIDQIRNRIDELESETPDREELDRLSERVDLAHEEKANRATVEAIVRRLDEEFVTKADASETIERRFDTGLHATVSLSVAVAAAALAVLLAVQNPAEPVSAVVTFLVGVASAAFWKFQQPDVAVGAAESR